MTWFVARDQQTFGPFEIEELHAAIQAGQFASNALVWREGLRDWIPAQVALAMPDLQVKPAAATEQEGAASQSSVAASSPSAPALAQAISAETSAASPTATKQATKPWWVWLLVGVVGLLLLGWLLRTFFGLALLRGITGVSYPGSETQVQQALQSVQVIKVSVAEFFVSTGRLPHDLGEIGISADSLGLARDALRIDDGTIVLDVRMPGNRSLGVIALEPILYGEYQLQWRCGRAPMPAQAKSISAVPSDAMTSLSTVWLPEECR